MLDNIFYAVWWIMCIVIMILSLWWLWYYLHTAFYPRLFGKSEIYNLWKSYHALTKTVKYDLDNWSYYRFLSDLKKLVDKYKFPEKDKQDDLELYE